MHFALSGEDYDSKPVQALLPQLNILSTQHIFGAYNIVGVSHQGGARLDNAKPLRAGAGRAT